MKKNILISTLAFSILLMSGCATKKPLYNYGEYSQAYYNYKKNTSPESELALQKAIEEAIQNVGDGQANRVAPGMYANLGYIYLKQGNSKMARESFIKEKTIYPESTHFMDRLIKKIDAAEEKKDEN